MAAKSSAKWWITNQTPIYFYTILILTFEWKHAGTHAACVYCVHIEPTNIRLGNRFHHYIHMYILLILLWELSTWIKSSCWVSRMDFMSDGITSEVKANSFPRSKRENMMAMGHHHHTQTRARTHAQYSTQSYRITHERHERLEYFERKHYKFCFV